MGRREIIKSLGPVGPGEARAIRHRLWSTTETLFMSLRLHPDLSAADVQAFSDRLLEEFRHDGDRELCNIEIKPDGETFPVVFMAQGYELDRETVRTALARNDLTLGFELMEKHFGQAATHLSLDDQRLLARAAMSVRSQADTEIAKHIRDEVLPRIPEDAAYGKGCSAAADRRQSTGGLDERQAIATLRKGALPFSAIWPGYVADRLATRAWTESIARQNKSSCRLFLAICGDKPLAAYGPLDGSTFRSTVLSLPVLYDKARTWRAMYEVGDIRGIARAVAEANTGVATGAKVRTLNSKTFNRHYSALSPIWAYARQVEALPKDATSIFDDLFVPQPKKKDDSVRDFEQRPMWSEPELLKILATPLFRGCKSRSSCRTPGPFVFRDERYWGILLGLHTGMRREELFQLQVRHISCDAETGIWHVDLFTKGLRLKDSGSPRYVPLHKNLIALGFIAERVIGRQPDDMLFPEAKRSTSDGKLGDLFGKWFGLWRRSYGVPDKMDFHSFRHTVATLLVRSGCTIPFGEEFIGHESVGRRSEFQRYNKGQTLRRLKEVIDRVTFPIDVEGLVAAAQTGRSNRPGFTDLHPAAP